jgi:hypothetical protein
MTYTAPLFGTLGTLGVDVTTAGYDQPYTATASNPNNPEYPAPPFSIGQVINLTGGGAAIYAQTAAATAITQGDFCYIASTMLAAGLTSTIAATAGQAAILGVAMATLTTGQFGWFQTRGNCPAGVNVVNGVAANTILHTSGTAGRLTGTAVTGTSYPINNIMTITTSGGTSGAYAAVIGGSMIINTATTLG